MKRIYISVVLLIIAACISAAETGFVSAKADLFTGRIEQTDKLMKKDQFEEAAKLCRQLEDDWNKSAEKIDMLLIHDYVDNIGASISKMRSHIECVNPDMYFAESTVVKKELASIKESEYPYVENIL